MYIQELSIEIRSEVDKNELVDRFHSFLYSLRKNGQSQSKQEASFVLDNFIRCNIQTLEKESLNKKYNTEWVKAQLKELENDCLSKLQIKKLGKTFENYLGVCKCKKNDSLILYTHLFNDEGALRCGTCFKPIPLYKLPSLDQPIKEKILNWEQDYICCDKLQIGSRVGDKWATKQMTDSASQLSKEGIAICSKIKMMTGIPTYYYLFNFRKVKMEHDKTRLCPSCGGHWLLDKPLDKLFDFKCNRCELISSLTSNGY